MKLNPHLFLHINLKFADMTSVCGRCESVLLLQCLNGPQPLYSLKEEKYQKMSKSEPSMKESVCVCVCVSVVCVLCAFCVYFVCILCVLRVCVLCVLCVCFVCFVCFVCVE